MNQKDLDFLEQLRKSILPRYVIMIALLIGGVIFFVFNPLIAILCIVGGILFFLFAINSKQKEYKNAYKTLLVAGPFQAAFDQCRYEPNNGLKESDIRATALIDMGDDFSSEDYVTGYYKDVHFERADVHITETHRDSKGNSHTVTLFRGRWMIFEFNKNFRSDVQLVQSGFGYSNTRSSIFTSKENRRHRVQFEDEAFNKAFRCFAQDEHEAFYVLTPHLLQSIQQISTLMDGKLMLGFIANRLHVAVATGKDSLEPSIFRAVNYANDTVEINNEINAITTFVNQLKLDQSIYS